MASSRSAATRFAYCKSLGCIFLDCLRTRQYEASCGLTGWPVVFVYTYFVNEMIATECPAFPLAFPLAEPE